MSSSVLSRGAAFDSGAPPRRRSLSGRMKSLAFMTVLTTVGSTVPVIPLSITPLAPAPAAAASIAETAPSVTAIARSAADGSAAVQLTAANTLYWKVTFTEDVTGVDETDFSLSRTAGSVAGYSITSSTSLNADPSVYLVTVNSGTGSGSLRLSLTDDGSISDTEASNISGTIPAGGLPGRPHRPVGHLYSEASPVLELEFGDIEVHGG